MTSNFEGQRRTICKRTKRAWALDSEDLDKRSKEEAQKALKICMRQSLENTTKVMQTLVPPYVKASGNNFSFFLQLTLISV
jgi:hypothetical protein